MTLRSTTDSVVIDVDQETQVATARRAAGRLASKISLDEEALGRLQIAVSEAATNQLRHAGHGLIAINAQRDNSDAWVEFLALDQGPGIRQIGLALAGGHSESGGLGQGLGAIQRLSDQFDIFAPPGRGTAVLSRIGRPPREDGPCLVSGLSRARRSPTLPREATKVVRADLMPVPCGDGWGARHFNDDKTLLVVLDGVGHGEAAQEAVELALGVLARLPEPTPGRLLESIHPVLAGTRGAAGLAVLFDPCGGRLCYAGLGNLHAEVVVDGERRHGLVSRSGTLGVGRPRIEEYDGEWHAGGVLVVQTDGVSSRWRVTDHPGLWRQDPGIIGGVIFREHARSHDDATVVAARCPEPEN